MTVICDSSVLIALSSIDMLNLLQYICKNESLFIPKAVWNEVVTEGKDRPGALEVAASGWIKVKEVKNQWIVKVLVTQLDYGEAEVIALALEMGARLVLLDEKEAREFARKLGLKVLGTIGLLIWAKKEGIIDNLKVYLDALQMKAGFRVSQQLYKQVLKEVNEEM